MKLFIEGLSQFWMIGLFIIGCIILLWGCNKIIDHNFITFDNQNIEFDKEDVTFGQMSNSKNHKI
jgi:hypothetical protein